MTCPSWPDLLAHRFTARGEEPAGWREALAHLAACPPCRRRALALDPTLLFAGDGALAVAAEEIADIRRSVRTLRRARGVESAGRRERAPRGLLAAGLAFAALLLAPGWPRQRVPETAPAVAPLAAAAAAPAVPLIENLDRPGARVYQWGSDEVAVVLVVDESLDV